MNDDALDRTSGHVYIAVSLDGFVARSDRTIDWLTKQETEGEEHGYAAFVESMDGIVMGRGSFETVLGFGGNWPYQKPVVVMSGTLTAGDVPDELIGRVRLSDLDPVEQMRALRREGWRRAYVDGGGLVQAFVRLGLIEDFVLTTIPILIGDGIRLFGELDGDLDLELLGVTPYPSGLVQSHYRVRRE
ncbi:MAG: dihydrofolate reductase family protein [Trueperaceae bacterium]|nr:MAG: dihydrofolate reductase family protein [Trueperaceae bacterium]